MVLLAHRSGKESAELIQNEHSCLGGMPERITSHLALFVKYKSNTCKIGSKKKKSETLLSRNGKHLPFQFENMKKNASRSGILVK